MGWETHATGRSLARVPGGKKKGFGCGANRVCYGTVRLHSLLMDVQPEGTVEN